MKPRVFLICISITLGIMSIKKTNIVTRIEEGLFNIRKLFQQNIMDYVCNKAGKSFLKKYQNGYDEKVIQAKKPNKYQQAIIDFAKDSKYKYIKKYFGRIAIFFVFLILDIIFIFCWIGYCSCFCCCCCCIKKASPDSNICRTIWFSIALGCNILVVIFSFVLLLLVHPFLKKVNGVACSTFNFVEHARDGLGSHYPKVSNGWIGIPGIETILINTSLIYNNILDTKDLNNKINNINFESCGINSVVPKSDLTNDINNLGNTLNSSLGNINFDDLILDVDDAYKKFTETEDDACNDVYDALHDYINKYVKLTCNLIFSLTLVFGFLAIVMLILYMGYKYNVFRIIYVIIWNFSMLLMLLIILLGIIFGILSYVLHDAVRVAQYILSKENLDDPNSLFINQNSFISDLVNICVNGDGEFLKVIQENEELKEYINEINENEEKYNNTMNKLRQLQCDDSQGNQSKQAIIELYETLYGQANEIKSLGYKLINLNCGFARNDEMIILRQIDLTSKKANAISGLCIVVGILLGISIIAGILFVHRYRFETSDTTAVVHNKTNESSSDINKEGNSTIGTNNS